MKLVQPLFAIAALALPFVLAAENATAEAEEILGPATPISTETGRYIVQFSSAGSSKFRKRDGSRDTNEFFSGLRRRDIEAKEALSFTSDIFHGASFDLHNATAEEIDEIKALPEVENVWPVSVFTVPTPEMTAFSSNYTSWSPHNDTNVKLAHSHGYLGEGVVVAVVDTGVDYTHPALGGGLGEGFKIEYGYDLVGDDWAPGDEYTPDDDPQDCNGHGTHVSGIIGSSHEAVPGVAPSARLRMYKVFGCGGSTYEDVIISGFLKAHEDGADIISASVGSDRGFPDAALAVVISAIQASNTFVSIAGGNSGAFGSFYTSSGGNGVDVTTVGSVQHDEFAGFKVTASSTSNETREIVYLNEALLQWKVDGTKSAAFFNDTRNNNACDWSQEGTVSSDKVLIEPRGDCAWQIHDSVLIGRAEFVFFYNNEGADWEIPSRAVYNEGRQPKGFGLISYDDGDWIVSQHEMGYQVSFDFVNDNAPVGIGISGYENGRINSFTSMGPTLDSRLKPEISAPGGSIFSTFPVGSGSWSTQSGTSMATPYIAGVAALFFGSRGGRQAIGEGAALLAHKRIVASGNPVRHHDGTENKASVIQQGAGLVDALKVIEYNTFIDPVILNLNDTDHFSSSHDIKLTNNANESVTYYLNHVPGITTHTKPQANPWVGLDPPYSTDEGSVASLQLSATEIVVGPGETKEFSVQFTEPTDIDANMLPVYGGSIEVIGSHGEVLRITYMGIKGSIYGSNTWELDRGVPVLLSGYGGYIEEGHNYTFEEGGDVPQPYFNMLWATREVSFDFVGRDWTEADWKYPVVAGENNYHGSFLTQPQGLDNTIVAFPLRNYPRATGAVYAPPSSKFANGEEIPAGEYRILCRVLRTFGDPQKIEDWQIKLSDWFRITREKPPPTSTTSTSSSATSTPTSEPSPTVRPCSTTATPISLSAVVGDKEEAHPLYRYSDFLSIDLTGDKNDLEFELTNDGFLQTWSSSDVLTDLFLNVHTSANSLVYIYKNSSTTAVFNKLVCEEQNGTLECEGWSKKSLYLCESGTGLVRFDESVKDGCEPVTLHVEPREDPNCN